MKNSFKIWATVLGISAFGFAGAQNIADPSYSVHNYKHPNKAAKMKAIQDARPEIYLEQTNKKEQADNSLSASANYKGMSAGKSEIREFRVSHSAEAKPYFLGTASRNYKQQFPSRTKNHDTAIEKTENRSVAVQ